MPACGAEGESSACWLAMRLKYSKARRSSCATPSPSAYIRPSFHCATGWPPSAAYCSEVSEDVLETAVAVLDTFALAFGIDAGGTGLFSALGCGETTPIAASLAMGAFTGEPSNPNAGASGMAPRTNAKMVRLDIRITLF